MCAPTFRAELGKKARMRGDLYYKLVEVHNGAVIDGRMVPQDGADTHCASDRLAAVRARGSRRDY